MRRLAWLVVAAVLGLAVVADFVASDRPIVLSMSGRTYWLPNLIHYDALEDTWGGELSARMTQDDWALWPPIRYGPTTVRTDGRLEVLRGVSGAHWLGTDDRGRDVAARLVHGSRSSLFIAIGVGLFAACLGLGLALMAGAGGHGTAGRVVDGSVVASLDVVAAVPALLVVVACQGLLGAAGIVAIVVVVGIPRGAVTARLARSAIHAALRSSYAEAARAAGASYRRVLIRHALPHAFDQIKVATALTCAGAVLAEAALSFLSFGTPPPTASWGELLKQAHENGLPWRIVVPAGGIVTAVAAALGALAQPKSRAGARLR